MSDVKQFWNDLPGAQKAMAVGAVVVVLVLVGVVLPRAMSAIGPEPAPIVPPEVEARFKAAKADMDLMNTWTSAEIKVELAKREAALRAARAANDEAAIVDAEEAFTRAEDALTQAAYDKR